MDANQRKLVISAIIVAAVALAVLLITRNERQRDLILQIEPYDSSDELTVYVGGAVEEPGLYSLPRGSRVAEALDMAGPLDETDDSAIDLAATLHDEQSIIVPATMAERSATASGPEMDDDADGVTININAATREELELLPGIGPAYADRIIERRSSVGPFQSLDELTEVAGISDRMVDDIRDLAVADS